MGYPYPQDATSTSPSRQPRFSSADQFDNKYQARRTNIPGQHNNYSNLIQNHPLQDQQCIHSSINVDHIHNTYTAPIHTPNAYHSSSRLTVHANPPYHKINTEQVTIPAKVNTMMTNPCTLPRSKNSLFELSKQHFDDQPVESTPVIIKTENENLPVHFINHNDHDVVVPEHNYVGAMEKVQESDRDNLFSNGAPEPVTQHALSKWFAHSDLLPSQRQSMHTSLQENSGVLGSSIADLSSTPLVQHYIDTANAKPIKQGLNFLRLTKSEVDFETSTVETESVSGEYPLYTVFQFRHHNTEIWRLPTLPAAVKQEGLLDVCTYANYRNHTNQPLHPTPTVILINLLRNRTKPLVSPESNLTWKEILTYGTTVCLKILLQPTRPEKTSQLYFLDWTLPPVLAKRLHISNHFALGVYDPIFPPWSKQSPTLAVTLPWMLVSKRTGTNEQMNTDTLDPYDLFSRGLRRSMKWKPNAYLINKEQKQI